MLVMVLLRSVMYSLMVDMVGLSVIETVSDKANSFKLNTGAPGVGKDVSNPDIPTRIRWLDIPEPMTSNDDIPTRGFMFDLDDARRYNPLVEVD